MSSVTLPGFIVAIDMDHIPSVVVMPKITEETGWLTEEKSYFGEEEYPKVRPGLYKASYLLEGWTDYYGEHDCKGGFIDFEEIFVP